MVSEDLVHGQLVPRHKRSGRQRAARVLVAREQREKTRAREGEAPPTGTAPGYSSSRGALLPKSTDK